MSRPHRHARAGADRASLYDEITGKIIAELEAGRFPWVQPWDTSAAVAPEQVRIYDAYAGAFAILWAAAHKTCNREVAIMRRNATRSRSFADLWATSFILFLRCMSSEGVEPTVKIDRTRAWDAEVVLYDRYRESREDIGAKIADERGFAIVKPFKLAVDFLEGGRKPPNLIDELLEQTDFGTNEGDAPPSDIRFSKTG